MILEESKENPFSALQQTLKLSSSPSKSFGSSPMRLVYHTNNSYIFPRVLFVSFDVAPFCSIWSSFIIINPWRIWGMGGGGQNVLPLVISTSIVSVKHWNTIKIGPVGALTAGAMPRAHVQGLQFLTSWYPGMDYGKIIPQKIIEFRIEVWLETLINWVDIFTAFYINGMTYWASGVSNQCTTTWGLREMGRVIYKVERPI